MNCELYIANCELYSVNCELYTVNCELYTVNCELYIVSCETYELTPIYKTTIKSSEIKSTDIPPLVIISCNDKRGTVQYGLQYTVYITIQLYTGGEFSLVSACLL